MQSVTVHLHKAFTGLIIGLINLAEASKRDSRIRWCILAGVSLASLLLIGYHTGSFDQSIHLPFLKAWADPTLYPTDPFIRLRYEQYSFFWFLFLPFARCGLLEPAMFVCHLCAVLLTFWATWRLAYILFNDSLTALIGVIVLAFPHLDLLGFPFIEFSLLNRTFALPFVLLAIDLYLRQKQLSAFALLGLLYNLHVLSVNYALIVLVGVELAEARVSFPKLVSQSARLAAQAFIFILTALPVLLWRFNSHLPIDLTLRTDWVQTALNGMLRHLLFPFSTEPYALATNLSGLCAVFLFFVAQWSAPSPRYKRALLGMVIACLVTLGFQALMARWLPVTFLMQLQLARVSGLLFLLCILSIVHNTAQALRDGRLKGSLALLTIGALILSTLSFMLLPVWALLRRKIHISFTTAWSGILVYLIIVILGAGWTGWWNPRIQIYPPASPWLDVQIWARLNTPKDALFITPPEKWDLYLPDWRTYSERATLAGYNDLLEVALIPSYLDTWLNRISFLIPGKLEWPTNNFLINRQYLAKAFTQLSDADLTSGACAYQVNFLVAHINQPHSFPVVYENSEFRVYELSCPVK
ncbi:MAG: hypothetical protein EHM70_08470 [Chloroflexota bacterium]|nr:MAG: hypothetical protein EHM70_08470 [Chloroflexota bacterium]